MKGEAIYIVVRAKNSIERVQIDMEHKVEVVTDLPCVGNHRVPSGAMHFELGAFAEMTCEDAYLHLERAVEQAKTHMPRAQPPFALYAARFDGFEATPWHSPVEGGLVPRSADVSFQTHMETAYNKKSPSWMILKIIVEDNKPTTTTTTVAAAAASEAVEATTVSSSTTLGKIVREKSRRERRAPQYLTY